MNAFLYDYIYNMFYKKKFTTTLNPRTRNLNFMMGGGLGLT